MIKSYKGLKVWQRSIELVNETYKVTEQFPKTEQYGLISQMRRAAVSIPSNIAEGYKRRGLGEYVQFLSIADASAAELETQVIISKDLYKKVNFSKMESLLEEIQKMLFVLIKKLRAKRNLSTP
jgi:four helix bundle protein